MTRIVSLLIGLLVIALQITLANFIAIYGVKPDFALVFITFIALFEGSTAGVIWGFILGVLLDAVGGGLLGLGALGYSIAGFLGGYLGAGKQSNRLHFMLALAVCGFAAHLIFLYFTEPWPEVGFVPPFLQRFLPELVYTWAVGALWMITPFSHFASKRSHG